MLFIQNALRNSLQIPYTPLNEYSLLEEEELIAVNELLQFLLFPAPTLHLPNVGSECPSYIESVNNI